jgi:hypothetical protein
MKKKMSEYIKHYLMKHSGDEEKIHAFSGFVEDFFHSIPEDHEKIKDDFLYELEDFAEEIDEEMMVSMVEKLQHKDGTLSGEKWSLDEVMTVSKQYDVKNKIESIGKKFDCHKFWFALNYVYAVHHSINRTINGYIDLAIDEYTNKNIFFDKIIKKIFEKM